MSNIVSTKELKQGFGVKQTPALVRTLDECKIKYWLINQIIDRRLTELQDKGMTDADDKDVAGLSESTKRIYNHEVPTNKPVK